MRNSLKHAIAPLSIGIVLLIVEHHSSVFRTISRNGDLRITTGLLSIPVFFASLVFSMRHLLGTWIGMRRYVRETYAMYGVLSVGSSGAVIVSSLVAGILPWDLPHTYARFGSSRRYAIPDYTWAEFGFLFLAYGIFVGMILTGYRNWGGLISRRQHERKEKGHEVNMFGEGFAEIKRVIHREPNLTIYSDPDPRTYVPQLGGVQDALSWRDQARELVRLSRSLYRFDSSQDWDDKPGCWVGKHARTDAVILVYPAYSLPSIEQLRQLQQYASSLAKTQRTTISEIIIALKGSSASQTLSGSFPKIRLTSEAELLDKLVDFSDYRIEIARRVRDVRLPDSHLTLSESYVPSRARQSDGSSVGDLETYLHSWSTEIGQRHIAVLGEYGQGKSTAMLMFAYKLLCETNTNPPRIPVLVELRGMSPRNLTPLQLLGAWAAQYRIEPQALMRLHIAGKLVLIFEGFDEMSLVGDASTRVQHFKTLWQFAYPEAKIIITGRPNFFLDEEEMKAALGVGAPRIGQPYCEAIRLQPFEIDQIEGALRAQDETVRAQICELSRRNERFRDLVSRPSLLHIVGVLWERERLFEKIDRLNSAYVMELFVRHSYRRQGKKEADSPEFMALTSSEREFFMRGIAADMTASHLPNQIPGLQLNSVIEHLIHAIPEVVTTRTSTITGEVRMPLRLRAKEDDQAVEHIKTDVRACGLLVDDPASLGTFRFGHKSFLEYLTAAVLADLIRNSRAGESKVLVHTTGLELSDILTLPVAIDFLAEMLASDDASSDGQEVDRESDKQFQNARRIFNVIAGESSIRRHGLRFVLFDAAYLRSIRMLRGIWQPLLIFLSPASLLGLGPLIATNLHLMLSRPREFFQASPTNNILFMWPLLLAFLLTLIVIFARRRFMRTEAFQLWNILCRKLGIHDSILHSFAKTSQLPWTRGQPFDYFIPSTLGGSPILPSATTSGTAGEQSVLR